MTTALETHFIHQAVVIPIERLMNLDALFAVTDRDFQCQNPRTAESVRTRLGAYPPDYFDDTFVHAYGGANAFPSMHYSTPLERGRVSVELVIVHDLGKHIPNWSHRPLGDPNTAERNEVAAKVQGKGGIVISGEYHLGREPGHGLYMECSRHSASEDWAYAAMLNSLCEGRVIKKEDLGVYQKGPMSYYDGSEVTAHVREFSLARLREGDTAISEFMLWLRKERKMVNSIGEVVGAAAHDYGRSEDLQTRADGGRIHSFPAQEIESNAQRLLEVAQRQLAQFQPPKNDRMTYLVPSA